MPCYNIYVFNRLGLCLYYHEWHRPKSVKQGAGTLLDDQKQMFGLFWTLSNFSAAMDPKEANKPQFGTPTKIGQGCKFRSFSTNMYKLHFLESPSGIKMVLNTTPDVGDLQQLVSQVYDELFVEFVLKNPLYTVGEPFQADQFTQALNSYLLNKGLLNS